MKYIGLDMLCKLQSAVYDSVLAFLEPNRKSTFLVYCKSNHTKTA